MMSSSLPAHLSKHQFFDMRVISNFVIEGNPVQMHFRDKEEMKKFSLMESQELSTRNRISEELAIWKPWVPYAFFYPNHLFQIAVLEYQRLARNAVRQTLQRVTKF